MGIGSRGAVARRRPSLPAACVALVLAGCGSTQGPAPITAERDLYDPSPSRRTAAVALVAQSGERRWLPRLVELLDDRDPAVRALANQTLEDITGRRTAYAAYAPPDERRPFVESWRAWLDGGATAGGDTSVVTPPPGDDVLRTAPRVDGVKPDPGAGR